MHRLILQSLVVVILMFVPVFLLAQTSHYTYLPTSSTIDDKFISIIGPGSSSGISNEIFIVSCQISPALAEMRFGVFDGEQGGHWDYLYATTPPLIFTCYADPLGDGSGTTIVGQWVSTNMTDNGWYDCVVPNTSIARNINGTYNYYITIQSPNPNSVYLFNHFKLRVNGLIKLAPFAIGFYASISVLDWNTVFPASPGIVQPPFTPTTYDGQWEWYLYVPSPISALEIWDGDFDFGSRPPNDYDTDDPDTPNNILPPWVNSALEARYEGVNYSGPEDSNPLNASQYYYRAPSIYYEIIDPFGTVYLNNNPSGNSEWERFRIDTAPFDRSKMDYHTDYLPTGLYTVRVHGLDIGNYDKLHFFQNVHGVNSSGQPLILPPTPPELLASLGDYVWHDIDQDGEQDPGESPLPNVVLRLYNDLGYPISKVKTDANGNYLFKTIPAGDYTVVVDSTSLPPGFFMTSGIWHWPVTLTGGDNIVYVDYGLARNIEPSCGRPLLAWYAASYKDSVSADRLRNWSADNHGGISDTAKFDLYGDYAVVDETRRPALYHAQDADLWIHHIIAAWSAEIDAFVVPWYGPSSYEQGVVKGLLDAAEALYQEYGNQGFDFRIIVAYHETAMGSLADNLRFLADSVLTHPAYYHGREGLPLHDWKDYPRPLYVYSPAHQLDAVAFDAERDRVMPADVELVWNWDKESGYLSGLVEGLYPYQEAADIRWDDVGGTDWGKSYLEDFYSAAQTMPLKYVVAGTWPGYDARHWIEGNGHWMDRQGHDIYRQTWDLARVKAPDLLLIQSWNDFNRGNHVHISELYQDLYYRLTRDLGMAWKGGRPCARGITDEGMTFAERFYNGLKRPLPEDILENALASFFRRDFASACSILEMGQASFVEGQKLGNKLVFVKGSPTHPGQGWDNAVDGDLEGWDGTVTTKPEVDEGGGTPWAIFRFADMGIYQFEYASLARDNGYDDNKYPERQASRIEVMVSQTGTKTEDFVSVGVFKIRNNNNYGMYRLAEIANARYIKLLIHEPKWTSGGWRQIVEFGVDNRDKKGAHPAGEQEDVSLAQVPKEFRVHNYPNPFNAQTTIAYHLPHDGQVSLKVYDVRGREVAMLVNEAQAAGEHWIVWHANDVASGLYFYRLRAGQVERSGPMLLLK